MSTHVPRSTPVDRLRLPCCGTWPGRCAYGRVHAGARRRRGNLSDGDALGLGASAHPTTQDGDEVSETLGPVRTGFALTLSASVGVHLACR